MADKTLVDYDQMQGIANKFEAEGEELTRLLMQTRQKVHDTQSEWIGRGADSFNDDMENKLLPAFQRLCEALSLTNQITKSILAVYQQSEQQAANLFKGKLQGAYLGSAGIGVGQSGGIPVGPGLGGPGQTVDAAGIGATPGQSGAGDGTDEAEKLV